MSKFEELKKEIKSMLMTELTNYVNSAVASGDEISKYGDRLSNIDETAIKYIMRLTNDYIRAKRKNDVEDMECDLNIFKKYGFDAHVLDKKIGEIQYAYNSNNEMWPSKEQEEILQTVCSFFEYPGNLPKVDTILEIASKFGATYGATDHGPGYSPSSKVMWLNVSQYFDDPYNTDRFFSTALNNGLSVDQIIESTYKLESYMDYYNAPNTLRYFSKGSFGARMIGIVPFLDKDHKRMSNARAVKTYKIINERLASQLSNANLENADDSLQTRMHR